MAKKDRMRVLVVDDDPLVRNLLTAVLHDASFDLDEAVDGQDALAIAAVRPPDVVVLDVMMPGLDGYEVCRALRADPSFRATRIVVLTAKNTPGALTSTSTRGRGALTTTDGGDGGVTTTDGGPGT